MASLSSNYGQLAIITPIYCTITPHIFLILLEIYPFIYPELNITYIDKHTNKKYSIYSYI